MTTIFFSIITLILSFGTQIFGQDAALSSSIDPITAVTTSETTVSDYIPREYLRQMQTTKTETKESIPSGFQKAEYQPFYHPTLSQIPSKERDMIKKIVSRFSLDKQKVMFQLRPAQEETVYQRDTFRLELSSLLENDSAESNDKKQIQELIKKIRGKEQELINLQKAEKHNIELLRGQMHKEITKIVNDWLTRQVTVTEEFLAPLIFEAEKNYDYISEIR